VELEGSRKRRARVRFFHLNFSARCGEVFRAITAG
jgi:hypothetical protein